MLEIKVTVLEAFVLHQAVRKHIVMWRFQCRILDRNVNRSQCWRYKIKTWWYIRDHCLQTGDPHWKGWGTLRFGLLLAWETLLCWKAALQGKLRNSVRWCFSNVMDISQKAKLLSMKCFQNVCFQSYSNFPSFLRTLGHWVTSQRAWFWWLAVEIQMSMLTD